MGRQVACARAQCRRDHSRRTEVTGDLAGCPRASRTPNFLSRWSYLSVLMKLTRMSGKSCLLLYREFPNFASSLFTSNSFQAMLQGLVLFYVLHIVNSCPLYQQSSPDLYTPSVLFLLKKTKITCLDPASGSPLKLPFQPDAHPFHPGYDSNHPVSQAFLQFLDTAIWHTFSPPELWKHRLPSPLFSTPGSRQPCGRKNQPQEYGS